MEKVITLKSISLRNFKGIKNQKFEFTTRETTFVGANGTGKSSLFAAFVWCLFGKDQFGRSNHQLKTLIDGKTDRNKECEVEIELDINGEKKTLRRVYYEKWSRQSTTAVEVFKANSTNYYINDVNIKESEYIEEIKNICPEDVFRIITNPSYFPNLREDVQRQTLFHILGEVDNETIVQGNAELVEFLQMITGKSLEVFKKEIANKKSRVEKEKKDIPARIDELKRTIPEPDDWEAIETSLKQKKTALTAVEEQLNDVSKYSAEQNKSRMSIRQQVNELERNNQSMLFTAQRKKDDAIEAIRSQIRKLHVVNNT